MLDRLKTVKEWILGAIAAITSALGFYDLVLKRGNAERIFVILFIVGSILFPIGGLQIFTRKDEKRVNDPLGGPRTIRRPHYGPRLRYLCLIAGFVVPLASVSWFGYRTYTSSREDGLPIHAPTVWEKAFIINGHSIAYASPDSTYSVIAERIDGARESIVIGMHDFTANHVKDLLLGAIKRGVRVSILLNHNGHDSRQQDIINELRQKGASVLEVDTSGPGGLPVYHMRVIVIDQMWTLVQSGDLTPNSVPIELAGNRDTGIALESRELATFFTGLVEKDMKQAGETVGSTPNNDSAEHEPTYAPYTPLRRFDAFRTGGSDVEVRDAGTSVQPSTKRIWVLPVLAPENYLVVLPQVLSSARESIDIYQQHIQTDAANVQTLLDAIKTAQNKNPGVKVRIILAKALGGPWSFEQENWRVLGDVYGWRRGDNLRIFDPGCELGGTNRLVIVDKRVTLIGSANWSSALSKTREACILVDSTEIANYYLKIFQTDWEAAAISLADSDSARKGHPPFPCK